MPQDLHASNTELRAFPFLAALAVMLSCPHTQQTVRAEIAEPLPAQRCRGPLRAGLCCATKAGVWRWQDSIP